MRARQFWALFGLGFVGVLSLVPSVIVMVERAPIPAGAPPRKVIVALSLIQPMLLMAAGIAIGLRLAPRLGLRSYVADAVAQRTPVWPALRRDLPLAVGLGVATMLVIVLLDVAFRPFMGDAWRRLDQAQFAGPLTSLVTGVLYGGITEELLVRWGLMSLVAWLAWRAGGGAADTPPRAGVMWLAILASAILFGVGHLPAVSSFVPLSAVVVARTVLLNAIAGVVYGWFFWRRSLEAAMIAHATGHVVLFVVKLAAR